MTESQLQYCPICSKQVSVNPRYPNYVCADCAKRVCDEEHRPLKFYNQSMSGGFVAQYQDTGEERHSHVCFIDGIKCWADEYPTKSIQPLSRSLENFIRGSASQTVNRKKENHKCLKE